LATLEQIKETSASIQNVSEAMQKLPLVGGYVENPQALLDRPDCVRERRFFADQELFEPSTAILSVQGKQRLDTIAPWLISIKNPFSEIVIASFSDASQANTPASAIILTRKQSQAVVEYLKTRHGVQKIGWFSTRKVTPLGFGNQPTPLLEKDVLPNGRVEIHAFVPAQP